MFLYPLRYMKKGQSKKKHFNQEQMDNFIALGRALKKVAIRKAMEKQFEELQANNRKKNNV